MTEKKTPARKDKAAEQDAGPTLPDKRAEISHADHGYVVMSVDGDRAPVEERYQRLEGIFQRIKDLQEAGYVVSLEGPLPGDFVPLK